MASTLSAHPCALLVRKRSPCRARAPRRPPPLRSRSPCGVRAAAEPHAARMRRAARRQGPPLDAGSCSAAHSSHLPRTRAAPPAASSYADAWLVAAEPFHAESRFVTAARLVTSPASSPHRFVTLARLLGHAHLCGRTAPPAAAAARGNGRATVLAPPAAACGADFSGAAAAIPRPSRAHKASHPHAGPACDGPPDQLARGPRRPIRLGGFRPISLG